MSKSWPIDRFFGIKKAELTTLCELCHFLFGMCGDAYLASLRAMLPLRTM
jgi:hypothetical protein